MLKKYRLIQGDCTRVLPTLLENSIDCVVTDPPYGISFMGKDWDKVLPPRQAVKEIFRILKPGALAFVMSSPRQDVLWRMFALLENVGFELKQSFLSWVYASGFPKAYDVSKGIDKKRAGNKFWEIRKYLRKKWKESEKTQTELMEKMGYPRTTNLFSHWMGMENDQQGLPRWKDYQVLKKELGLDGRYDLLMEEAERKVIGKKTKLNSFSKSYGVGFNDYKETTLDITIPASDLAKKWSGWKSITGLKPALECILMVNKPRSEKTIVDNVLKHGVGAINVDACRIPFQNKEDLQYAKLGSTRYKKSNTKVLDSDKGWNKSQMLSGLAKGAIQKGRFPANLLVSDEALDTGKITKSGAIKPWHNSKGWASAEHEGYKRPWMEKDQNMTWNYEGDSGGFSRFFSLDSWWHERVKRLPEEVKKTFPFLVVPKASKSERDEGLSRLKNGQKYQDFGLKTRMENGQVTNPRSNIQAVKSKNIHPTVKPLKLMSYLIELGCPSDGVVLDPFLGSGTTMLASEIQGRNCIGIEINPEYCNIARLRCFTAPRLYADYQFEVFN